MAREVSSSDENYYMMSAGLVPLRWTAPETIKSRQQSTFSDVWSFGILCCEVISNGAQVLGGCVMVLCVCVKGLTSCIQPYQGLTNEQVMVLVDGGGHIARPENCPPMLFETLIKPCFAVNPLQRPSFAVLFDMLTVIISPADNTPDDSSDSNFPRRKRSDVLHELSLSTHNEVDENLDAMVCEPAISNNKRPSSVEGSASPSSTAVSATNIKNEFYSPFDFATAKVCQFV
jgi:serine/threonine protein kinase